MENDQGQIYLFRRISELALISEGIVNALEGQDYRRFDILIQQSRKLKATVRELKKTVTKFDTDSPEQEKEVHDTLKEYLEKINAAEVATHRHIEGLVQTRSRDELLSTPEGCAVFAEILLPASWDLEQGLVGIIGSGGHFLAQKLQERGQKRILIYDPSHDPENSKYPEGVMIAQTNIDIAELCSSIQGAPSTMHITSRSPDPNISDSEYNEIAELFREGVTTHQIMQNTVDRFGEYWVTHSIENIPYIIQHPSLKQLERAVRGRPLIMASPGPSLDKNIDELYKIQNKAVICCISQCVGKLISKGIKPDFVFAADPQNLISHFEKVNGDNVGALVLAATVNPKLYRVPATRFITMAANGQSDEWLLGFLGQQPNTSAGGSVACSVFALSAQAKCHPIILVGQDLAFSEGRRYAEEASKAELSLQFSEDGKSWVAVGEADKSFNDEIPLEQDKSNKYAKLIQLPGYYGETVNTSEDYKIFWNWFAKSATNLKDELLFLNCTEGGAFIPGMEHIPLKEAAEKYLHDEIDKESLYLEVYKDFDREKSITEGLYKLEEALSGLERCSEITKDATLLLDGQGPNKLEKLDLLESELMEEVKKARFISIFKPQEIREALKELTHVDTVEESFIASKKLYAIINDCHKTMEQPLKNAIAILKEIKN